MLGTVKAETQWLSALTDNRRVVIKQLKRFRKMGGGVLFFKSRGEGRRKGAGAGAHPCKIDVDDRRLVKG